LALEIREIDHIPIDQAQSTHASRSQIERDWRAESSGADAKDAGGFDPFLPLQGHLGHDQMPRVPGDFVIAKLDSLEAAGVDNAVGHKLKGGKLSRRMSPGKSCEKTEKKKGHFGPDIRNAV
jgi:hypothetical protein